MKRYKIKVESPYPDGEYYKAYEDPNGEWVKFEDVKKFILKLTDTGDWHSAKDDPVEHEECTIVLISGQHHPAMMINGNWVKPEGYMYDFDFDKSDIILWKYNNQLKRTMDKDTRCNCAEKAFPEYTYDKFGQRIGNPTIRWVCPVHGYKKL